MISLLAFLATSGIAQDTKHPGAYLMDFKTVATGDRGESADKDVVIARTLPQWEKLRVKIGIPDEKDAEARQLHGTLGAMDWGREQVVFARTAQQRTGGYSVSVQRLTKFANSWRLDLVLQPPGKDVLSIEVLTTPYVVFRMRKTTGDPTLIVHVAKAK